MSPKSNYRKSKHPFFILFSLSVLTLFSVTQNLRAGELLDLSSSNFSFERLAAMKFFSPSAVMVINTTGDQNDQIPGDGFCNDGAGNCSLRAAIQESNALAGAQVIDFDIPGGCDQIISPTSPLPALTDPVTIDGYSQSGSLTNTAATGDNAKLCVILYGINAGSNADGLQVNAINSTIRGLAISKFGDAGIEVNANGAIVEGNFVGTDSPGTGILSNRLGIIVSANNALIGGTTLASRNIVSGNTRFGITLNQGGANNVVQNNYVGLGANSAALGNGESGINVFRSGGNTIGGASANARNVISGNGTMATGGLDGSGINVFGDTQFNQSANNTIQGNYIGTNPAGTAAIANQTNGILIFGAINATMTGNVVSGNAVDGIGITGAGATGNVVKSNIIGLDAAQSAAVGNSRDGVSVYQVGGNTVGGTSGGDGNRIGSNARYGILISGTGGENNLISGNFVGFNVNNESRPHVIGIALFSNNNIVGGTTAGARNYVAGNGNFGITVASASGSTISGNYIGLTNTGAVLQNFNGIFIQDATNNIIGGTAAGAGNVVSGNQIGIRLIRTNPGLPTTGNQILGNFVGTNPTGTTAIPNIIQGVVLQAADSNIVGGTTAAARNLISGNTGDGLSLQNDSKNNQVSGNYIGTTADGATALANGVGVKIDGASSTDNVIGGTATGAGNLISGNTQNGIQIQNLASSNRVEGNIIGLNAAGSAALLNLNGIALLTRARFTVIGGTAASAGNVISGNDQSGILFDSGASTNRVEGNKIGTDATGTIDLGNGLRGVEMKATDTFSTNSNSIGGTTAAARNVISGNDSGGIRLGGTTTNSNIIAGNYIGTKADGSSPLPNDLFGVLIDAPNSDVGGANSDSRNVISGQSANSASGILVYSGATNLRIQNNYIGTNADGSGAVGNYYGIQLVGSGVTIDSNLISGNTGSGIVTSTVPSGGRITNNKIGTNAAGTAFLSNGTGISINFSSFLKIGEITSGAAAPNVIAGNAGNGIEVVGDGSVNNLFRQNSIYGNGGLGIDLGKDGVTQNDIQDTDTGSNNLQNFPVINTATSIISGNFNSTPNHSFRLEFFSSAAADPSGYGEGQTFITFQNVTTDASGNATFYVNNPQPLGSYISATATDTVTSDTSEFSGTKQTLSPTAVKFNGARAVKLAKGVLVEWQTGRESDNLGFNVYRGRGGKRELVTPNLVAGSALTARENLLSEQNYSFFDAGGDANSDYSIEAVDVSGRKESLDSIQTETSGYSADEKLSANNSPTLSEIGQTANGQTVTVEPKAEVKLKPAKEAANLQKLIAQNSGVRLTVRKAGVYRVEARQLFANGLPANVSASNLRLFADGIEQPLNIKGAESGVFDKESAVEFYGIGSDTPETDARIYYLVAASGGGLRMTKSDAAGQRQTEGFYNATVERRDRTIYFSGLLNGDADNFFGAVVNNSGTVQTIKSEQLAQTGGAAELEVSLQGVTRSTHSVGVELNGTLVATVNFNEMERGNQHVQLLASQLREGDNTVRLVGNNNGDVSVVDYLRLTYPRQYRAANNSIVLNANGGQEITVGNFTSKNVRVFDVTNPDGAVELNAVPANVKLGVGVDNPKSTMRQSNYSFKFTAEGSGTRRIIAAADDKFETVADAAFDNPSNLKDSRNAADLLVITKPEFFESLKPLVSLRESQGLTVKLVDVADIYDEFSFGQKSSASIKAFLSYAATKWSRTPQFLLLAGDATNDPRGYLGNLNADVVQTKLVDTDALETASDEWFTDFDNSGVGALAVGRLPARNADEMTRMAEKIANYENQKSVRSATFAADVSDGGFDFAFANQTVSSQLPQGFSVVNVKREDGNAKSQILSSIADGQSIVSYVGHGSNTIWRGNLLTGTDAAQMTNRDNLTVFLMMTCLNGYFQDPNTDSLSEILLKNPNGGAAAVWASSGIATPDVETDLDRAFVNAIYNRNLTIGQAAREAKLAIADKSVRQTWTLLGDPSMRVK